ncbi:carbohydrate kinase family protein [Nocardioides sp.]|uniref:carbohydrate kinase family protein n=1 Tax=Nocardioides sp. TaxID=35761 RepID=UPI0039E302C4
MTSRAVRDLIASNGGVLVVGGANMDLKARSLAPIVAATSNPGATTLAPGGVGRNIAENLARLGTPVALLSAVGTDALGADLLAATAAAGVDVSPVRRIATTSGTYTAVLDASGELVVAVADMAATEALTPDHVLPLADRVAAADLVVLDGNLLPATATAVLDLAAETGVPVVVDPVSVPKAARLAEVVRRPLLAITPNRDELVALTGTTEVAAGVAALHAAGVEQVWVRLGPDGSLLSCAGAAPVTMSSVPGEVVDVTGAGDAMLAAFCHFLLAGADPVSAARLGHVAAALTIASEHTVRPDLTASLVQGVPAP